METPWSDTCYRCWALQGSCQNEIQDSCAPARQKVLSPIGLVPLQLALDHAAIAVTVTAYSMSYALY